ncbi:MAG: DUF6455 family protein [Pseudomonadota bacterium]|uniref:DUF6455 family protein n=2 Tax=Roseovarius TaxID=74030 RepID=UPI0022BDEB6F|nr:DUF6455 family protein [Roseovarius sp. EGI FJ00037]
MVARRTEGKILMNAQVRYLGDPTLHFWLTRSVARAMNLNLSEAMTQGHLTARDYAEMVTRCRKCPHVEICEAWLATPAETSGAAPDHCRNAQALNALADRMEN